MKIYKKIIYAILIIVVVSIVTLFTKEGWWALLYSTILALFANEIKNSVQNVFNIGNIRLSYSYLFRIQVSGNYLLVKDGQGRDQFQPVGGVYKYNPNEIDIESSFDATYDNIWNNFEKNRSDLRIIMKKNKLSKFEKWFNSNINRENLSNLSREFIEELIDTNIVDKKVFNTIKYRYVGSFVEKSTNSILKMPQIRRFDIIDLKITNAQRTYLTDMLNNSPNQYIFATKSNIDRGFIQFMGTTYKIAKHSNLILVGHSLNRIINDSTEYTVNIQ